jgi:hypothetical protein
MTRRRKKVLGLPIGPQQPSLASRLVKPGVAVVGAGIGVLATRRVLQGVRPGSPSAQSNGDPSAAARSARAEMQHRLKSGDIGLEDVLRQGDNDDAIGRTRVKILLQNLPGVGPQGAMRAMDELGIDEHRRIKGLGSRQRDGLIARFSEEDDSGR